MNWLQRITVVTSVATLMACGTIEQTTNPNVIGVDRKQSFSVPAAQFNQQAAQAYAQILQEARAQKALDNDSATLARTRRITNHLIAQAPKLRSDSASWPWEVHVFKVDELNAWCMPQGRMAIYSGLINQLKLTDAEIAAVMGHEISHALREHSREQASQGQLTGLVTGVLGVAGQIYGVNAAPDLAQLGADLFFNLPFSRDHEREADMIGLELMARAGYNPDAASTLWDKMMAASGGEPPQFLSTHPSSEDRKARLQEHAGKVRHLYQASVKR